MNSIWITEFARGFTLPLPPRNNRYYRHDRGITHLSSEGKQYKQTVAALLHGMTPLEGNVVLHATIFRARKAGDLDGFFKGLLDAMNGIAYTDDRQIVELHAYREDDKDDPRVEVRVEAQ